LPAGPRVGSASSVVRSARTARNEKLGAGDAGPTVPLIASVHSGPAERKKKAQARPGCVGRFLAVEPISSRGVDSESKAKARRRLSHADEPPANRRGPGQDRRGRRKDTRAFVALRAAARACIAQLELRDLLRHRATLTRMPTAVKNRVRALLARQGIRQEHSDLFGKGGHEFLASLALPDGSRRRLDSLLALIADFDREFADLWDHRNMVCAVRDVVETPRVG